MYKRILLAYDGTKEGRAALREGALLAKRFGAQVFFLSVINESVALAIADSAHGGAVAHQRDSYQAIFEDGLARLKQLGLKPTAKIVAGDPSQEIAAFAKKTSADLVVVSHRRQSMLSRWWTGSSGAYLSDNLSCSLLIGRNTISDAEFEAEMVEIARAE